MLETEGVENRQFLLFAGIRLGRRGSGVQIAPPRPIESIKYGQLRLAAKSSVDDIEDTESGKIRPAVRRTIGIGGRSGHRHAKLSV
jgi:hypothetical protein